MKFKKLLLTLGTVATVAAPIAAVVSCGDSTDGVTMKDLDAQATTGYMDSINKVVSKTLDTVGGWGDLRSMLSSADFKKVSIIGAAKSRISNDGVQVNNAMKPADQYMLQKLLKFMIGASKTDDSLKLDMGNKTKTGAVIKDPVFTVYSHSDYSFLDSSKKVGYMDGGVVATKNAISKNAPKKGTESDFFETPNVDGKVITDFATKSGLSPDKRLKLQLIPSKDPATLTKVQALLQGYATKHSLPILFSVSTDYNTAASALDSHTIDAAFLPVDTWAGTKNTNFIVQAGRPLQVATMTLDGNTLKTPGASLDTSAKGIEAADRFGQLYTQDLPAKATDVAQDWVDGLAKDYQRAYASEFLKAYTTATDDLHAFAVAAEKFRTTNTDTADATYVAGAYEAYMYGNKDSDFTKTVTAALKKDGADFKLKLSDTGKFSYGYTSTTSSSSYVFRKSEQTITSQNN